MPDAGDGIVRVRQFLNEDELHRIDEVSDKVQHVLRQVGDVIEIFEDGFLGDWEGGQYALPSLFGFMKRAIHSVIQGGCKDLAMLDAKLRPALSVYARMRIAQDAREKREQAEDEE